MNILLIAPTMLGYAPFTDYTFPLGIAYISSSLKQAGHDVHCVNAYHLSGISTYDDKFREIAKSADIGLIGIGGFSSMYFPIETVLDAAREAFPAAKVILGGNIVTCLPEKVMEAFDADFGIIGEGEISCVELAGALETGGDVLGLPGVAVKLPGGGGRVHLPREVKCVDNLDDLPFPDYEGFDFAEYLKRKAPTANVSGYSQMDNPRPMILLASRSCPHHCTFCYHYQGGDYRQRSLESIFVEIDYCIDHYGINTVEFWDDMFATKNNRQKIYDLCAEMKKRSLPWSCQITAAAVDRGTLSAMRDSGCWQISYGIESASPRILRSMRKPSSLEEIETALSLTYDLGMDIQGNVLIGDREETLDTFAESMAWWLRNRKYILNLSQIFICPNSQLYLEARQRGLIGDELEYIKIHSLAEWILNVTRLPDGEFRRMLSKMNELNSVCGYYPGFLLRIELQKIDAYGFPRYRVETVCPHCGAHNKYEELRVEHRETQNAVALDYYMCLHCRGCFRRYHIVNLELAVKYRGLPKRLFSTNYPPHNLLKSYLRRGGSVEETLGMVSAVENLLQAAGRTAAYVRKIPIPGGRNNRVWRLNTAEGPLLLKEYFQEGDWDRLAAESRFLRFCARAGVSRVPRLLAEDAQTGLALHGWLSGDRLDPEKLGESDVAEAAAFLAELAAVSRNGRAVEMPPARDACLRLDDFFRSPRQRLANLEKALLEPPETAVTREARRFLRDNLRPAWEQARAAVMADLAGKDLQQPFPDDMLMFSPSDAGFHNALRLKGDGLAFVDFEYAGLDSPAKLLGDFVAQPDFPPPAGTLDALATALADNAAAGGELAGLVGLLMPLFRIKFCCIILNDFKMLDAERRDFAEGGRQASRLEGQLARAKSYLSSSRLCGDDLN